MQAHHQSHALPLFSLEPDALTGNKHFRVYNFEGDIPSLSDLLIPHRKDYYLLVFMRKSAGNLWIDMTPYSVKASTIYLMRPNQVIVKEGIEQLWSTGIAFTAQFLSLLDNASLASLALVNDSAAANELVLNQDDARYVEDIIKKINTENLCPGPWQQRMLGGYLTILLTYLSRLYATEHHYLQQPADQLLLRRFMANVDENFKHLHEVSDYALLLNISAGHLSEVIKIQSGKSAIKHIHARLVMEARRLLFHTDNGMKKIAYDLGFSDTSYFNRFFKRETGQTPAAYRTQIREMYH